VGTLDSFFQMGGGNFGIGRSSPSAKLEVDGAVDSIGGRFRVTNPNNQAASITLDWINDTGSDFPRLRYGGSGEGAANGFRIQAPGDVTRLAIDAAGNVGIGTTTPGQKLEVDGPARVERLEVTGQLGSAATPEVGALYRDSLVKAWSSTGATGTLLDGFNLTVTQQGTGIYAYTFRRAMATAVYAVVVTNTAASLAHAKVGTKTTTGFVVITQNPTGGLVDREHDVIVIGN
jgi:hypothetical protein